MTLKVYSTSKYASGPQLIPSQYTCSRARVSAVNAKCRMGNGPHLKRSGFQITNEQAKEKDSVTMVLDF